MRLIYIVGILIGTTIGANAFFNTYEVEQRIKQHFAVEPPVDPENPNIEERWVTQRLDNFDPQNLNTWENRYYANDELFEEGGPIYLFVTGFNPVRRLWLTEGLMFDIANDTSGYLFASEHRFYGQSRPTEDLTVENMQYLNQEQTMIDLATLISEIKQDPELEDAPVVIVGQLYGASIAAWFRKRYPHLVVGVWASSPRIVAQADVYDYLIATADDISRLGSENCQQRIESAFLQIQDIIEDEDDDGSELNEIFNLCQPIDTEDPWDVAAFAHTMAITFGLYVDYGGETGIENMCEMIEDESITSDLEALANFISYVYDFDDCLNFNYEYMSNALRQEDWDVPATLSGAHQWTYQLCTEFGWFRTSIEEVQPFGHLFPVDIFYEMCADVFGDFITREFLDLNIAMHNHRNGGLMPSISNAIYTIGDLDPWRTVAITQEVANAYVFVLEGQTTSADLLSISMDDDPELFRTKNQIRRIILDWVHGGDNRVETRWISQKVDYFNPQDWRTWEMRYMANNEFFVPGGPVFIFIGGQWPINTFFLQQGMVYDIAQETNGYIFGTEHRYYGESRPTTNLSPANLRYLTSDQALADLATFMTYLKRDYELQYSRFIMVSSGYGATLATWFKRRYPHLVDYVWASSARLEPQLDFSDYFMSVGDDISLVGGNECYDRIENGFNEIVEILEGSAPDNETIEVDDLDEIFNLCTSINTDDEHEVVSFLHGLAMVFSIYIEVGGYTAAMDICEIIEGQPELSDVEILSEFVQFMYPDADCLDVQYRPFIDRYDDFEWDSYGAVSAGRQWFYQRCTEFAWFRTTNNPYHPFSDNVLVEHFIAGCNALFGDFITEYTVQSSVDRINALNGGLNPELEGIIFTNGALDPWRGVGLLHDPANTSYVYIIPSESQSADLFSYSPYDSVDLREIKNTIKARVKAWALPPPVPH